MSTEKAARICTLFYGTKVKVWHHCTFRNIITTGVLQDGVVIVTEEIQELSNRNLEEVLEDLAKKSEKTQGLYKDELKFMTPGLSKRDNKNPKNTLFLTSEKVFGNTLFVEIDGALKVISNSNRWRSVVNKMKTTERECMIDVFEAYDLIIASK